jgi:signal transduction histidine kinase
MEEAADPGVQSRAITLHYFMRHLAHELGNPVASIRMSAEMLLSDFPQEMHQELFQIIMSEALRLESLIESAVYFSSIGALNPQQIDPKSAIDAALRQCEITIPVEIDSRLEGETIRADNVQMARLLREVLTNAAQAGAERICIDISQEGDSVVIRVVDDGEGIPPERLDRATDPFYTSRDGRLGLGLTTAKRIAELHKGSLEIANAAAGGTVVTIRLSQSTSL